MVLYDRLGALGRAMVHMEQDPLGMHGIIHWLNVYKNACMIDPDTDNHLFYWNFAMLHDAARTDDNDQWHAVSISDTLNPGELDERLIFAIRYHSNPIPTMDKIIEVCWDADALDIGRTGIKIDKKLLRTKEAKAMVQDE